MSLDIPADKIESLPFRIKKFDYNRYYIDHPSIKGILNLANIVNNVGKVPDALIPPNQMPYWSSSPPLKYCILLPR